MKKLILILAFLMICLTLNACNAPKEEPATEPPTQQVTEAETEPTTEPPTEPTTEPEPTIDLENLVTDAYSYVLDVGSGVTLNYNIPQINLDTEAVAQINSEIYSHLYDETMQECVFASLEIGNDIPICLEISYEWYINDDILSLVITEELDADIINYIAYNLYISEGIEASNEYIILSKMSSLQEYRDTVKEALGSMVWNSYGDMIALWQSNNADEMLAEARYVLESTISVENIDACAPYLGENGDLYIIGDVYSLAGASKYSHIVNLNDYELAENYSETI